MNERTIHQFRTRLWGLTAVGSPPKSPSDEHLHRMMHVPLGECSTQGCPLAAHAHRTCVFVHVSPLHAEDRHENALCDVVSSKRSAPAHC